MVSWSTLNEIRGRSYIQIQSDCSIYNRWDKYKVKIYSIYILISEKMSSNTFLSVSLTNKWKKKSIWQVTRVLYCSLILSHLGEKGSLVMWIYQLMAGISQKQRTGETNQLKANKIWQREEKIRNFSYGLWFCVSKIHLGRSSEHAYNPSTLGRQKWADHLRFGEFTNQPDQHGSFTVSTKIKVAWHGGRCL